MTVKELIEHLQQFDGEMEVVRYSYDDDYDITHYYKMYESMKPKQKTLYEVTCVTEACDIKKLSDRKRKINDSVKTCNKIEVIVL